MKSTKIIYKPKLHNFKSLTEFISLLKLRTITSGISETIIIIFFPEYGWYKTTTLQKLEVLFFERDIATKIYFINK